VLGTKIVGMALTDREWLSIYESVLLGQASTGRSAGATGVCSFPLQPDRIEAKLTPRFLTSGNVSGSYFF
jgi:hypothetical protein